MLKWYNVIIWTAFAVAMVVLMGACGERTVVVMTPAPQETATKTVVLTSEEEKVYLFVSQYFPKLRKLNEEAEALLTAEGTDPDEGIALLMDNSQKYVAIAKKWEEVPWGGGRVDELEDRFDEYVRASARFYKNWVRGVFGEISTTTAGQRAGKAAYEMDQLEPVVEERLAEIEEGSY